MRAIDPIKLTGMDGTEYEFLLSMGGIKRLKRRYSVKGLEEIWKQEAEGAIVAILFEAMIAKPETLTEEAFADNLSADISTLMGSIGKLMGVSLPDERPTEASEPNTIQ